MNAVIYARFSSDRQREESIEGQLRECREYAEANGITIVGEYIDRALSASKETEKRLDFLRMIKDSSKHLFDLVLVWKLDRFARNRYDSAHYKAILKKNGVKVVSVTERIADGADGVILEAVLEGMAEYYSLDLSEKIHRGQKENALKAQCNGGRIPFGYQLINHRLEKNPFTAPIVQEVFSRYANGDTVRSIVDDLNQRGIKSSMGYPFTYSSFGNLLKNRTYIGEFHYDGVIIPDGVPALVSKELFERAQIRREKNKHAPAMAKAKENYILTTKLFCGMCGKMMAGESGQHGGKTYRYYKCSGAKRKMGCTKKAVKKEWIENLVVQQTMLVVMDEPLMERLTDRLMELQGEESYDLKLFERQKREVEQGIENMINAIQAGIITPSTKQRLTELESEKSRLEKCILKERLEHPRLEREQISFFLEQFKKTDVQNVEQRQRLIDCFVNAVFVYDDKIILTFNYKNSTKTIKLSDIKNSDLDDFVPPEQKSRNRKGYGIFCIPNQKIFLH